MRLKFNSSVNNQFPNFLWGWEGFCWSFLNKNVETKTKKGGWGWLRGGHEVKQQNDPYMNKLAFVIGRPGVNTVEIVEN